MEHLHLVISIHSKHVEATQVSHKGGQLQLHQSFSSFLKEDSSETPETIFEHLDHFLTQHELNDYYTSVILPNSQVLVRQLHFPFRDQKKIKQVLRFEVENELPGDVDDMVWTYRISAAEENSSNVSIFFVEKTYLDGLTAIFNKHNLLIKNTDFSAYALHSTFKTEQPTSLVYQVYLGFDEVFISVIEKGHLQTVKQISNEVGPAISEFIQSSDIDSKQLSQTAQRAKGIELPTDEAPSETLETAVDIVQGMVQNKIQSLFDEEINWILSQLNFFMKSRLDADTAEVQLLGGLSFLLEYKDGSFSKRDFPQEELNNLRHLPAPFGVLKTIQQKGLRDLEGHDLSFYSEGTPFGRFFRKYRFSVAAIVLFGSLCCGLLISNMVLEKKLLEQEYQKVTQELEHELRSIEKKTTFKNAKEGIQRLQELIETKKQNYEQGIPFQTRSYAKIAFINQLSSVIAEIQAENSEAKIKVEHLELTKDKFTISGTVESYDSFDALKKRLFSFEELKDSKLDESNRSTPDGIHYRLVMTRS